MWISLSKLPTRVSWNMKYGWVSKTNTMQQLETRNKKKVFVRLHTYCKICSIFRQNCFEFLKCWVCFGQIDDKFSCKTGTEVWDSKHDHVCFLMKQVSDKLTYLDEKTMLWCKVTLPKSFSLIPRWFSSSVHTFDTKDKYSRRFISSKAAIFPAVFTYDPELVLLLLLL